jgi:Virulence factor
LRRHVEIRHRLSGIGDYQLDHISQGNHRIMPAVTIVYWRDIPAQVIVGTGRRASKIQLTERFEQAIDRCAMKIGAKDADAYLAEWRKAPMGEVEGEPDAIAAAEAARLEAEFDTARLKELIATDGWAKA